MNDKLLQHIQALSNSQLGHFDALETFARCFDAVYGESSFLSLESGSQPQQCRVRLVFHGARANGAQLETFLDENVTFTNVQAEQIMHARQPRIVDELSGDLQGLLREYGLPHVSMMAIPLFLDGEIHRWVFVVGSEPRQFDEVNLEQAILLANLANTYMARIDETQALARANAWIEKELNDIGRIQKLLLPQQDVALRGTQIATWFSACDRAGGDYFDVINLTSLQGEDEQTDTDSWGNIIADASGHGAAAAVEIAMLDAILRTYHESVSRGPANVFNYINKHFFTRMLRGSYITASILNYDASERELLYANAGHPPALLRVPGGEVVCLDQGNGIPLGVDPQWQWENMRIASEPGSVLVNYTDGIIEALSVTGEQFGLLRLKQCLQCAGDDAEQIRQTIITALNRHRGAREQNDDQALVVIVINN